MEVMEVRFRHFRETEDRYSGIAGYWYEAPLPLGGATVAVDVRTGCCGVAVCSARDRFSRPAGRVLALDRLRQAIDCCSGQRTVVMPRLAEPTGPARAAIDMALDYDMTPGSGCRPGPVLVVWASRERS